MAYRDESGKITIDEAAAQADIQKIMKAQEILSAALNALKAAQAEAENAKGQTAQAIWNKAAEVIAEINRLDSNLEETMAYIRKVVAIYKAKDAALKVMMESGMGTAL